MKTLTEFSTLTLRKAAEARSQVAGTPPPPPAPEEVVEEPAADAAPEASAEAGDAGEGAEAADGADSASEAAAAGVPESAPATPESDPVVQALATQLAVQPDRAARLIEALDIVGNRIDQVRLVRVFQGEKGPHGAISRGEFHYVVDRVAGPARGRRDDRDDRRGGGDRGGRGGGGGGGRGGGPGGRGDRDKPRGLGSLKMGAPKEEKKEDDRPGRGEMPRAGIGWQLTAAPRDFGGGDRGGPRRGRGGPRGDRPRGPRGPGGPGGPRGPGGPGGGDRRERRGPGGPGGGGRGPRPGRGPMLGPDGQPLPDQMQAQPPREPRAPRLGPDGQPLPPKPRRERKPIGPDANGLGPDGKPWDPERRAKRQAEREAQRAQAGSQGEAPVNTPEPAAVEGDAAGKEG